MTKLKKIKFPECRYKVEDFQIIDTQKEVNNGRPIYIREILDSPSAEFKFSTITAKERLDIIGQLGLDCLVDLLAETFRVNHHEYKAEKEAFFSVLDILTKAYPRMGFHARQSITKDSPEYKLTLQLRLRLSANNNSQQTDSE
jgi:hypothetical protein